MKDLMTEDNDKSAEVLTYFIKFDEKKLKEVAKVAFDSVDTDRSGQIDQEELEKVMAQISQDMGAEPPSKEDVKEVLEHLDTDHSGKIDFEEFSQLIKDVLNAMIEEDS